MFIKIIIEDDNQLHVIVHASVAVPAEQIEDLQNQVLVQRYVVPAAHSALNAARVVLAAANAELP